ncbi:DedA family protein, partial [Burkholderia pseudomallei]
MPIHAAHAPRRASRLSAAPMPPGSAFVAFEVRFVWHFPQAVPASLGPWAVFASVLVTQLGMPVPAVPMLIVGGTMAAMGQASYASMLVAAVAATVLADSMWFFAGRARGRRLLNALVRFSLSLDTTLRIARKVFEKHGAPLLVLA